MDWPYAYGFCLVFWLAVFLLCWRWLAALAPAGVLTWIVLVLAAAIAAFFSAEHMDWR